MHCHLAVGMRSWPFRGFLAFLFVFAWTTIAAADTSATIVRVEEDWELVVATPDSDSNGPQLACVISPVGDLNSFYVTFELNHQSLPSYVAGGLQLQVWNGETPLNHRKYPTEAILSLPGETVCWTQSVEVVEGGVAFEITNGNSTTWGEFGGQGYLKATVSANLANLNAYSPDVSVGNSGVSYAANRVESLTLRRVRVFTSTGEVLEDTTVRPVE